MGKPRRAKRGVAPSAHTFIVIAPNESPYPVTARSWLAALGKAMEDLSQTATLNDMAVSKSDRRTWVAQERGTSRRYLVIDTEADEP